MSHPQKLSKNDTTTYDVHGFAWLRVSKLIFSKPFSMVSTHSMAMGGGLLLTKHCKSWEKCTPGSKKHMKPLVWLRKFLFDKIFMVAQPKPCTAAVTPWSTSRNLALRQLPIEMKTHRSARAVRARIEYSHRAVFPAPPCRNSLYGDNKSSAKGKHISNLFVSFTFLSL